jgi:Mlc titration factor MtfA (ptsG expression regulator)
MQRGMLVSHEEAYYSGLAWQGGPLIFSWPNVLRGSRRPGDGANVVIHEFVHHIDGLDGEMGGTPIIDSPKLQERWESVFHRRYHELVQDLESGREPLIDDYAATNMAEFFAVASENFFDSPQRLQRNLPDVYEVLREYFDVNPVELER